MHMRLTLWDGEQFQNLKSDNMNVFKSQGAPYDRETFDYKQLIFDFDSNFNELEASQFADIPQAKDMRELNHYVDSVNHLIDSSAVAYFNGISSAPIYGAKPLSRKDSLAAVRAFEKHPVSFDLLLKKWKADQQNAARQMAVARLQSLSSQYDWQSETVEDQIWYFAGMKWSGTSASPYRWRVCSSFSSVPPSAPSFARGDWVCPPSFRC